jgi:dTMP kinase
MEILKNFAVFEGCDGSGTTTQLNLLEVFFQSKRHTLPPLYKTFEPTNGSIGRLIRSALRKDLTLKDETIALLFAADRNEHLYAREGIKERCERGELVVSDRYLSSSLVYQGITCGVELPSYLNRNFPGPELLLFFDIDPEIAQKRMEERGNREIFEDFDFQAQARERYKALLPQLSAQGVRVQVIDAAAAPEEVAREVWTAIKKMPIFNR